MATKHTILYAEDDIDDVYIIQQAFNRYRHSIDILHAQDGIEAIQVLHELHMADRPPCLIILDINMPVLDGRETLVRIKQTESFKDIPVVMFTTSSSPIDKEFAATWKAEFVTKPLMFGELEQLARRFIDICGIQLLEQA